MYKQQLSRERDRQRAKALEELMEENDRWNEERRDAAKSDIRRIVNAAGKSNPELRKEKIYFWEKRFIEDKEDETTLSPKKTILRKNDLRKSGDSSPMYKQQLSTERDRQLEELMEKNARWNEERRDAAKSDIRRIVNAAGKSNPELRKEKIYFWEKRFIEDKEDETTLSPKKTILRKNDLRKSGDSSPMYKQQLSTERDRQLEELMEKNAGWNEERRDAAKSDIRTIVNAAGKSNPELRKDSSPMYKQQLSTERDRQLEELMEKNAGWNEERRDAAKSDIRTIVNAAGKSNPELRKDSSPMYKQQLSTERDRQLEELMEKNAGWNEERRDAAKSDIRTIVNAAGKSNPELRKATFADKRDAAKSDIRRVVNAAGQSNPELRKAKIYSWEKGFIEDKEDETTLSLKKTSLHKRDAAKSDIRRVVNAAGQSNPELRKAKIYSWEKGFIEDKEDETALPPKKTILRKDDLRKSEQALTKQTRNLWGREGLNLAIKRAKPNTGGPSLSSGPKTQEEVALKKTERKSKTKKDANKEKAKSISSQPAAAVTTDNNTQSSSTPRHKQKTKLNKVGMSTKPEDILDTFQNTNLAPAECENLADQVISN
ncbi:uncharacterized protein LOC134841699 [Symsagittifera roscoffensis]|uniref:uncharacterized protein LOC134841699 n=1 Tax=Symsagittifera roscoffensis TaxID=84072 RepID=UPI00307C6B15